MTPDRRSGKSEETTVMMTQPRYPRPRQSGRGRERRETVSQPEVSCAQRGHTGVHHLSPQIAHCWVTRKLKRDLNQRNGARNQCAICGCQTVAVACIAALPLNQQTIALMNLPIHEIIA